ncbi:ankyrin repeat domain-containing protein [Alistipes sp. ZOR0009]|uniref:ankyrin repeat domain-containing protein n=1 Tax=Alistipes sp. ZOR0009 TaxID=1339253 RepID=UPI000645942F|nr:ankyrin repeat domain-containing protein [Alistipes sp. ZOR0009]
MKENIYQTDFNKTPKVFEFIKNHQNIDAIKHLEYHPEEINLKGWMDHTPLHTAAEFGNFEMTKYLIENGAEINAERNGVYATPLCWSKTLEIAILLLDSGATMNDRELDMATRDDRTEIINELLTRGAKINLDEPQFLNCHSIKALEVYLNHNIDITLTDKNRSSILHSKAWADDVEVFEFAFKKGARWNKDSSNRTPYVLAQQGAREKIIQHLQENYPELTSHQITKIQEPESLSFEQIYFFSEHPVEKDEIIALTESSKLLRYISKDNQFNAINGISIDLPTIRNFTFDESNNIIIPTLDNKLLKVDSRTFELLESINFYEAKLDQITFLPRKKIYLSSDGWTSYILDLEFNILMKHTMDNGVLFPFINKDENLVSTYCYDQETYHSIYTFSEQYELKHVHTFFIEWNNSSEGFGFNKSGTKFAVSFPKFLSLCEVQGEEVKTDWSIDISKFTSEHDLSDLIFIDDNFIALAKGKKIILYSLTGELVNQTELDLKSEIREIKLSNKLNSIIIRTPSEIISIEIEKIKKGITKYKSNGGNSSDLNVRINKKQLPWWKRLWS